MVRLPGRGDPAIRTYLAAIFFVAVFIITAFVISIPAVSRSSGGIAILVMLDVFLAIAGLLFLLGAATPATRRPSIAVQPFAASPPRPPEEPLDPEEASKEEGRQRYLKMRRPW